MYMTTQDKALDMISRWDEERGEGWSDSTEDIADIMVAFLEQENKEIVQIFYKSTKNRRWYKNWEKKIIRICGGHVDVQ